MALSFEAKQMSYAQIFQIFSLVYIAVGIGILINPDFYKKLFEDFIGISELRSIRKGWPFFMGSWREI